jgi:S1-C subfamily serine protease
MQQGDVIRVGSWVAVAGAGAGLALAGAAVTGRLGSSTNVEQITPSSAVVPTLAPSTRGLTVQEIFRLDAPGVVRISDSSGAAAHTTHHSLGSGFVIDKAGHIVTSNRVVSGARALKVSFSGADEVDASIVGHDPTTDVAVLQVDAHSRSLSPLPLGDSDLVQVGDPIVAIGNSRELDRTATVGIISGVQHGIDTADPDTGGHAIQTDAPVDDSGSGGPVINTLGQVIGVSSRVGGVASGRGNAIPIDTVKSVVAQLLQTGTVRHVYLGLGAASVSRALARAYALPCDYGLMIQAVTPGSGAAAAGLRAGRTAVVVAGESYLIGGDIIIAADGKPVSSDTQLRNLVEAKRPGDTLALQIWRGDRKETVDVKLGRPPAAR